MVIYGDSWDLPLWKSFLWLEDPGHQLILTDAKKKDDNLKTKDWEST
jgi:hypothetical protein